MPRRRRRTGNGTAFHFDEIRELFSGGVDYLEIYDTEHSRDEDRFIAVGPVRRGIVVVVYTERHEETVRVISARLATSSETRLFRQYMGEKV
jgi:uncharacterized DUF497 family protein